MNESKIIEENNCLLEVAILKGWKVYNCVCEGHVCVKHTNNSVHKDWTEVLSILAIPKNYKTIRWAYIPNNLFTYMRACV